MRSSTRPTGPWVADELMLRGLQVSSGGVRGLWALGSEIAGRRCVPEQQSARNRLTMPAIASWHDGIG